MDRVWQGGSTREGEHGMKGGRGQGQSGSREGGQESGVPRGACQWASWGSPLAQWHLSPGHCVPGPWPTVAPPFPSIRGCTQGEKGVTMSPCSGPWPLLSTQKICCRPLWGAPAGGQARGLQALLPHQHPAQDAHSGAL